MSRSPEVCGTTAQNARITSAVRRPDTSAPWMDAVSRQSRHGQSGADHQNVDHSAILTASANRHQAAPSGRTPDCQPRRGRALDSRELMVISERSQPPVRDFREVRVVSSFRSLITKGVRKSPRSARVTALVTNHSRNSAAPGSSTATGGVLDS